jgi:hypothetical protein
VTQRPDLYYRIGRQELAIALHKRFTTDYDLPNDRTYCESCATVGLMMFGQRMAELTERCAVLRSGRTSALQYHSGRYIQGGDRTFFCQSVGSLAANCLPATINVTRKTSASAMYESSVLPDKLFPRTLASLGQYIYAEDDISIYINLC